MIPPEETPRYTLIAQKLCNEIVESPLKPFVDTERDYQRFSPKKNYYQSPTTQSQYQSPRYSQSNSKRDNTRSTEVEKKRDVNQLVPNNINASRIRFKSRETVLKKTLNDTAINTTATGPLRCDTDCVTLVRRRDNRCTCKSSQKRIGFKPVAKLVQTTAIDRAKIYSFSDKACAQCIETITCGTQFLDLKKRASIGVMKPSRDKIQSANIQTVGMAQTELTDNIILKQQDSECLDCKRAGMRQEIMKHRADLRQEVLKQADLRQEVLKQADLKKEVLKLADLRQDVLKQADLIQADLRDIDFRNTRVRHFGRTPNLNYMGARRWALSKYPTRGPDF